MVKLPRFLNQKSFELQGRNNWNALRKGWVSFLSASQGRHATKDEITASAYQAVTLDQTYNGEPVQVRVTMGKEPAHLMAIFKGRMVVYAVSRGEADCKIIYLLSFPPIFSNLNCLLLNHVIISPFVGEVIYICLPLWLVAVSGMWDKWKDRLSMEKWQEVKD